jgi:cobalt-zinc-cadmium efflux system outer membrane protein
MQIRGNLALRVAALSALFLVPASGVAQNSMRDSLTEDAVIALARANNPNLAAASGRRIATTARARQDATYPNPTLEWRRENMGSPIARDQFTTLNVPLDLAGRRIALRGAARAAGTRATADSVTAARTIELAAVSAYWRAILAREALTTASEQRAATVQLAEFDASRAAAGEVAEVLAMRSRLEADRARIAEGIATGEMHRSLATLAKAIGMGVEELPPLASLTGARPAELRPDVPNADSLILDALANRSELVSLRAAVSEAAKHVSAEDGNFAGDVMLQAGTKNTGGYSTGVMGVLVPLPLFNRNEAGRTRARAELLVAQSDLRAAEDAVRADVISATENYLALLAIESSAGDAIARRADDVLRIADAAYRDGGVTQLELLESQRARAAARETAANWTVQLRLARAELAWATGADIMEPMENR